MQPVIGWAGFYWVDPAENWGEQPGGYDLRGAVNISFWAAAKHPISWRRDRRGWLFHNSYGNAICNANKPCPNSVCPNIIEYRTISQAWQRYTISLPQGKNLQRVVGGFGLVLQHPPTLYLDDNPGLLDALVYCVC